MAAKIALVIEEAPAAVATPPAGALGRRAAVDGRDAGQQARQLGRLHRRRGRSGRRGLHLPPRARAGRRYSPGFPPTGPTLAGCLDGVPGRRGWRRWDWSPAPEAGALSPASVASCLPSPAKPAGRPATTAAARWTTPR